MGRGTFRTKRRSRIQKPPPEEPQPPKTIITIARPGEPRFEIQATKVEISMKRDYVDVTSFGNANKEYLVGLKRFTITGY